MRTVLFILLAISFFTACESQQNNEKQVENSSEMETTEETRSLEDELNERKENFTARASQEKIDKYEKGIQQVEESGVLESALKTGDTAPNFTLNNHLGEEVELYDILEDKNVVLTWYRGGWCPYCNLTLRYLQNELPEFRQRNAEIVAVSPEQPDNSLSTAEKNNLEFTVLSDIGNEVAQKYGVAYTLPEEIAESYNESFGLNEHNGDNSNVLPIAATYVINQEKEIVHAYLDADYRNRAEPEDILNALDNMEQ